MSRPKKRVLRAETWQLPSDTPIEDPETEKQLADQGFDAYTDFLIECAGVRCMIFPLDVLRERVSNVYRLCFEKSDKRDLTIIEDFAAHWSYTAFGARWVSEILFREQMGPSFLDVKTGENRLLKALSRGFARAARPESQKHVRRHAAYTVLLAIKPGLEDVAAHIRDLQNEGTEEAIRRADSSIGEKLQELESRYGSLGRKRRRVAALLRGGKGYDAAVTIAAHAFGVPERTLEKRTEAKQAADRIRAPGSTKQRGES